MANNMTIKKWNTNLNSGSGGWEEQYPKTTQAMIYDSGSTTTSLFDSNKKLKVAYLPDAVFDSLYFQSTFNAGGNAESFAGVLQVAVEHAITNRQGVVNSDGTLDASPLGLEGYYFVVNGEGTINELQSSSQQPSSLTVGTGFNRYYYKWQFSRDDSGGGSTQPSSSGLMEVGDWIVVEKITGRGSSAQPFNITFGVISNTYEVMTGAVQGTNGGADEAGARGLVPDPGATDYNKFLRGDGTWVVPTNTQLSNEQVEDIVGAMINTTSGISVTYADNSTGAGKLNFTVSEMVGADLNNGGTGGLVPAPAVGDMTKFLRGDGDFATPNRRIIKINGTEEISQTSSTSADFKSGLGVNVSATSGSGTLAGEVQFSMQYPIAVNDTESNVSAYEVANGLWFHIT